jgi:UDP-glucose 4-epimerase
MNASSLNKQVVLVTGARGFIGNAVCRALISLGATVHGVGRSVAEAPVSGMAYTAVDLTDADAVVALIETVNPAYILHLAGCSIARRELEWVAKTFSANLLTTVNLLTAAEQVGVEKVVIAGSLEQPDEGLAGSVPTSPYAASKWAATGYGKMFHLLYGMKVATARIFMVYGPGQNELQKMIPYVCLSSAAGIKPKLMSGTRRVDWVYIDDVADGLTRMLTEGPNDGSMVDIGTGRLVSTGDVAESICQLSGSGITPEIGAMPDRTLEREAVADTQASCEQIKWSAVVSLEDGLRRTLDWYKEQMESGAIEDYGWVRS